jgi:hypothetical protein
MKIDPAKLVTVTHAAELAGVDRYWMRQLVRDGVVSGVCIDGVWFADRAAAERYERHPTAGRPRQRRPRRK